MGDLFLVSQKWSFPTALIPSDPKTAQKQIGGAKIKGAEVLTRCHGNLFTGVSLSQIYSRYVISERYVEGPKNALVFDQHPSM